MIEKKGIAEALNLPTPEQLSKLTGVELPELYSEEEEEQEDDINLEEARKAMESLKAMRVQLREIPDITSRKALLDRLAEKAEEKFNDIFDRAFNCEDRYASEMINAATAMLKIALDAHSKVIDSDVKLIDLQIKKDKIEIELNQNKKPHSGTESTEGSIEGEKVTLMNRNERLAQRNTNK